MHQFVFSETPAPPAPVTITERPYTAAPSTPSTTQAPIEPSTTTRPAVQTVRPSFMTKPIDGAPYNYRPPEINLPSAANLDANSEQNSDNVVNKITYSSVNKYQNVHRPSGEVEASPHNKISSSLSIMAGARPMAVAEQHAENSIPSGENQVNSVAIGRWRFSNVCKLLRLLFKFCIVGLR